MATDDKVNETRSITLLSQATAIAQSKARKVGRGTAQVNEQLPGKPDPRTA